MINIKQNLSAAWVQLESAGTPWGSLLVSNADELKKFVSVSGNLRRSLMVQHTAKFPVFPEFDAVSVSQSQNAAGNWFLIFELLDMSHVDEFLQLSADMLENASGEKNSAEAIRLMHEAYTEWLDFYKSTAGLTINVCRGLYGELTYLRDFAIEKFGAAQGIDSWVGPLGAPQDFVYPTGMSNEVKTVQPNASSIKISSLQQLSSTFPLALTVVRVANSYTEGVGKTIGNLVGEIEDSLNPTDLEAFRRRLKSLRIDWKDSKINTLQFAVQAFEHYEASSPDFPKLTTGTVMAGILSAQYEVYLPALSNLRLESPWIH